MPPFAASRIRHLQNRISQFGDQLAYKELFIAFHPTLMHFVSGIIRSHQSAEEIVSDLFIKLWEKRITLEKIQNLRVYYVVAARHLSINQLEKEKRIRHANIENHENSLVHPGPNPEQGMISAEMMRLVHEAVENLPLRCKLSFKFIKQYRFKYREAAEILQVSEKTIENQLAIALKKIGAAIHFDAGLAIFLHTFLFFGVKLNLPVLLSYSHHGERSYMAAFNSCKSNCIFYF